MTHTATGLGIAAALGFAVSLAAQTTTTPPQTTTTTSSSQQSTSRGDKERDITVTGCLARGSDGTYMLNNARMDDGASTSRSSASTTTASGSTTTASGSTTTGSSNPTTTTGTTGTTGASSVGTTAAEPSGHGAAMSWKLEGGKDLDRHVGHTIQVTGHTNWNEHSSMASGSPSSTTGTTGAASTTTNSGARLDVTSVKMVAASCQ